MSWRPEARPEWVSAIDRGEVLPIAEVARRPFDRDQLLAEARARLGLDADAGVGAIGGDESFVEPLDVVLRALEDEARLTLTGRWLTRRFLLRLLEVRFQLAAYVRADPGVRDEIVAEPLVVTGAPRTGTTILYGLLALDPSLRAPEGWELLRPLPPPHPDRFPDAGRLVLADTELRMMGSVVSGLDAIHAYGGRMPKECLSAMSFAFLSEEFTARYRVPSYVDFLMGADLRPAYEMHRLVLQVLQRRFGTARWLLKSPVHLHGLDALFAVYPDARLVVTHRDPLTLLGSVSSLVANLRWAHSDHVDLADIGRYHEALYLQDLDGLAIMVEEGRLDPARTHHGRYDEFVDDPMGAVRAVYAHHGMELAPEAEAAMAAHLEARPKGVDGEHRYDFADLGLDAEVERERFARYCATFGVRVEER